MRRFIASAILVAALAGCNTYAENSFQKVQVVTPGVEGADCYLETEKNKYHAVTPMEIVVERSPLDMKVTCQKAYYRDTAQVVPSKIKMWYSALNVANGVIPGTAYDVASRSIHAYPDLIEVSMEFDQDAYNAVQKDFFSEPVSQIQKKKLPEDEEALEAEVTPKGDKAFDKILQK